MGNLVTFERFAITFARAFTIGDNKKNKTIVLFSSHLYPQLWQTFRANVMSSLKTLNKLLIYQEQGISVQLKNGRLEELELVALFLLKTETYDAKNS